MEFFYCMVRVLVLVFFSVTVSANDSNVAALKQQANQFLSEYQNIENDASQLDQLEFTSQELLKKLQNCEKQAKSDLSQLTEIREIGVLKSDAKDSQNKSNKMLPASQATQEVDRQINDSTQMLITCRLKSSQVAEARLSLLNQKQNIWLKELTQRQDVWSFLRDKEQVSFSMAEITQVIPVTEDFAWFSLLALLYYALIFWRNRATVCNLHSEEAAKINLKETSVMLLKLFLIPSILAWVYFFIADDNQWHVLILVGGLLIRDSCALLALKLLVSADKIKTFKWFMWSSSILLVLVAFGFNSIHFQDNIQTLWLVNYSQVFTPLIVSMGVLLALTNWFFYQLLRDYRDRIIPMISLVLTAVSTLAFMFSYAYGAQYVLLLITGLLLVHWFLKSINWLRKILLSKKIAQLKQDEKNAGITFAFPFWVSLFTALGAGLIGLIFLGWLGGVSEEAFKQISFVFSEGFDVGSVRLVPQDILIGIIIITILTMLLSAVRQGIQNKWFDKSRLRKSSREVFSMIVWYIGITIAVFLGLTVAGFDISKLAIIAGALSVGIGFGLQNIVSNFVSGLILLFERPITRGDWIEVGGTVGLVEKVKIRATRIRTFDNSEILVPNSELLSHHVTNWTLSNSIGRVTIKVGVAYGSDVNLVRDILNKIATSHGQVMQREPYKHKVLFRAFGDSSLNFELRVMIKDIKSILDVETDINFAIDKALREAGITIPFPQRDLHIIDSSVIRVGNTEAEEATDDKVKIQQNSNQQTRSESPQPSDSTANNQTSHVSQNKDRDKSDVEQMMEEDEKRKEAEDKAEKSAEKMAKNISKDKSKQ